MRTRIILLFWVVLGIAAEALTETVHLEDLNSDYEHRNMDAALPSYLEARVKHQKDLNDVTLSPKENARLNAHHAPVFVLDVVDNGAKKVVKKDTDPVKGTAVIYVSFSGGRRSSNGIHSSGKEFAPRGATSVLEEVTCWRKEAKKEKIVKQLHQTKTILQGHTNRKRQVENENDNATPAQQVADLTAENQALRADKVALEAEVYRLYIANAEFAEKNATLERENKILDQLREANNALNNANRRLNDLTAANATLTAERDNLDVALRDTEDALKDAENKLANAKSALAALTSELEQRLVEKDGEIEAVRKSGQLAIEELQRTHIEVETRYKSEIVGIKEKYATDIRELEVALNFTSVANVECVKQITDLQQMSKALETTLENTRRQLDDAYAELSRSALATELQDALLESAERARNNAENELAETSARLTEVTLQVTVLTNDKHRMEDIISAIEGDLDEALNGRRAAEERADRLQVELHRLAEKLRQEQETAAQI